jgi:hypothetical protein
MVSDKLKALEAARAKLADLEQSVAGELNKELASLPARYGFQSVDDFVRAVSAAAGGKGRRGRKPGAVAGGPGKKRRKRAVITDAMRAQVKKMVSDGKTGAEIAKAVGISLPSVQNIKKALGLVKER